MRDMTSVPPAEQANVPAVPRNAPAAVEGEADVRDAARKVMELYSDKILDTGPLGTVSQTLLILLQRLSSSNVWLCCVVVQGTAAKLSLNMLWMSLDVLTAEALTLG